MITLDRFSSLLRSFRGTKNSVNKDTLPGYAQQTGPDYRNRHGIPSDGLQKLSMPHGRQVHIVHRESMPARNQSSYG